jgi:hypothetical protein
MYGAYGDLISVGLLGFVGDGVHAGGTRALLRFSPAKEALSLSGASDHRFASSAASCGGHLAGCAVAGWQRLQRSAAAGKDVLCRRRYIVLHCLLTPGSSQPS